MTSQYEQPPESLPAPGGLTTFKEQKMVAQTRSIKERFMAIFGRRKQHNFVLLPPDNRTIRPTGNALALRTNGPGVFTEMENTLRSRLVAHSVAIENYGQEIIEITAGIAEDMKAGRDAARLHQQEVRAMLSENLAVPGNGNKPHEKRVVEPEPEPENEA